MMLYLFLRIIQKSLNTIFKIWLIIWKGFNWIDMTNEAIWLAVLSKERHEKIIGLKYQRDAKYRKNGITTEGLKPWEQKLLDQFVPPASKIAIIGAGGGREPWVISQQGHQVEAYEMDQGMVTYAQNFFKQEQLPVSFYQLPINTIPNTRCDVFWFGWGVYTHIIGKKNRIKLLVDAQKCLVNDGQIIISYWHENRPVKRIDQIDRITKKINRREVERGESFRGVFWGKFFTKEQIIEEAGQANLKVRCVGSEGFGYAVLTVATKNQNKSS